LFLPFQFFAYAVFSKLVLYQYLCANDKNSANILVAVYIAWNIKTSE